jgi:phospholipid/cholesterol/gamma-HCH transport system substrate-binding protein
MRDSRTTIFFVLGASALVFLCTMAAHRPTIVRVAPRVVRVRFDDVGNLKVRAAVRTAGVTIGRVRTITFDPADFRAEAMLEIDADVEVPCDSTAKILTAGLLGDQYVGIDMGSDARMLADGQMLTQSQSALALESLIAQFIPHANDTRNLGAKAPLH